MIAAGMSSTTVGPVRWLPALALGAGLLLCAGCTGTARIELTSLDFENIDPPPPRVGQLDIGRCFWWEDEEGQVWIAMERQTESFYGPLGRFTFQMSLVLEEPPAGRARNYDVTKRELRAVVRLGPMESRFESARGILALYREPGERLRGTFRLLVARENNRMLGGWSAPRAYLMLGEFEAVHDPEQGRPIVDATETGGWEREPRLDERPRRTIYPPEAADELNTAPRGE